MSRVSDLIDAYKAELSLTWNDYLSGGERVWMLVYPPDLERQLRHALPSLELATTQSGHGWHVVDVTDNFGRWVSSHRHAEAFYEEPSDLTQSILDQFETVLVSRIREALERLPRASRTVPSVDELDRVLTKVTEGLTDDELGAVELDAAMDDVQVALAQVDAAVTEAFVTSSR